MDKAIGAIGGTALAAYIMAVVAKGNGKELTGELVKDWRYLEFLTAIYVLYLLHKSDFGGQLVDMFVTTAIIALLIKMAAESSTDFSGTLSQFAKGELGITETLVKLFGLNNPHTVDEGFI